MTSYLFRNDVRSLLGNLNTSRSKATGEQEPDLKVHSMLRRLILIFALIVVVVFVIALPVLTGVQGAEMIAALVMLCHMTGPCDQASAVSSFRTLTPITTCGMQAQTAAAELLFDFGLRRGDVRMVVRCEIGQRS